MSKFYKISEEQLIKLLRDSMLLDCLEKDGVDNWGYYGEGFETDITIWAAKVGLPLFNIREEINKAIIRGDSLTEASRILSNKFDISHGTKCNYF